MNTKGIKVTIQENLQDLSDLQTAVALLESPSIIARMSSLIGSPLEEAVKKLPTAVSKKVNNIIGSALHKAADAALWSLDNEPNRSASTKLHKLYAATSGALGGAFGFTSLFIELPISTTIIMRAVADVARSEGFDLNLFTTKTACVEVFALGANTKTDDNSTDTGYYLSRSFMTKSMNHLSKELAEIATKHGAGTITHISHNQAGKWFSKLIETVASQFGIVITNKFAAQVVPIIGAITGATMNTLFTSFYQDMARGHFIIKRLEAKYGYEHVKEMYNKIKNVKH
ncbi:EcsC family protein [Gilliamella sp. wkB171]|uniref:EcsC family protein n=1 Tax=Gilliamella sp. wkB171 TaxID=3120258 RepID=UPI000813A84D|nr:EcsC family protein [Gilliamella apicola]OCL17785.1 peptidase [Gilliamella apicola]